MTANPPSDAAKAYNTTLFKNRIAAKDPRQHAACSVCYSDATSNSRDPIITFTCPNGHTFYQTVSASDAHGKFLARFNTSMERNA